jgi:hypothetical protein
LGEEHRTSQARLLRSTGKGVALEGRLESTHVTVLKDGVLESVFAVDNVLVLEVGFVGAEDARIENSELSEEVYPSFRVRSSRKKKDVRAIG